MCPSELSPPSTTHRSRVARVDYAAADAVVALRGEHDLATVDELAAVLHCAAVLSDRGLVVDLAKVRFIDAATFGAILACRNELLLEGRSLTIRSPSATARRLLDICGLQNLIDPREVVPTSPATLPRQVARLATVLGRDVPA